MLSLNAARLHALRKERQEHTRVSVGCSQALHGHVCLRPGNTVIWPRVAPFTEAILRACPGMRSKNTVDVAGVTKARSKQLLAHVVRKVGDSRSGGFALRDYWARRWAVMNVCNLCLCIIIAPAEVARAGGGGVVRDPGAADALAPGFLDVARRHHSNTVRHCHSDMTVCTYAPEMKRAVGSSRGIHGDDGASAVGDCGGSAH